MNCLLGETSIEMQVNYLGTRLTGKVQELFYSTEKIPVYLDTPSHVKQV